MSLASKSVFALSCIGSIGIVGYVHYRQKLDRDALHEGVVKDLKRQDNRKAENLYILQQQIELTKELKAIQYADDNPVS